MPSYKTAILRLLRLYAETPLRGRTRLTQLLHPRLCPQGHQYETIIPVGDVSLPLDLGERSQARIFYGFYEPNETAFLRQHLGTGQVFVDAGANIGYYTALGASRVGRTGRVHAFEPVPWLYQKLSRVAQLALDVGYSVRANQVALADTHGQTTLWTSKADNIGWATIVEGAMNENEVKESISVQKVRLDDYFLNNGLALPDLVKIDVEFGEVMLLEGMKRLFQSGSRPILLCEVSVRTIEQVLAILQPFGYKAFECGQAGRLKPLVLPLDVHTRQIAFMPEGRS